MSDPASKEKKIVAARRAPLRVRLEKQLGLNEQSIIGVPEIAALAASLVMLFAVGFAYYYSLVPARARLEDLQRKRTQLQARLRDSQEGVKSNTDTQATVLEISESLQNFEGNYLSQRTQGRTALIGQLDSLIRRNNARVSTGFSFASLDALAAGDQTGASMKTGVKGQTSFPGIAASVTVEGQYANLRHLIRDIEASNQFIVINAVELQGITDVAASRAMVATAVTQGAATQSATQGTAARQTFVSLRLDLTAYFRRDASMINDGARTTSTNAPASLETR